MLSNTAIHTDDKFTHFCYHKTVVVSFNHTHIILDTGSWWTATTKRRMNQASEMFGLQFTVIQTKGNWFVEYNGKTIPFNNNNSIVFHRGVNNE